MTRVNSLSTLAGNVAHSNEGNVQSTVAEHQTRKKIIFARIAYGVIISRFTIEDYMSTFRIVSTSSPPIM